MDLKKNKEEFVELLRSTGRDGVEDLLEGLETMGFFTAPAAAGAQVLFSVCIIPNLPSCRNGSRSE